MDLPRDRNIFLNHIVIETNTPRKLAYFKGAIGNKRIFRIFGYCALRVILMTENVLVPARKFAKKFGEYRDIETSGKTVWTPS